MGYEQILLVPNGSHPQIFNVRRWGAAGDGVTDDTSAIQSAIDALPTGGGVVYFPTGVYLVSNTITLRQGVHLIGSGVGSQIGATWYGTTIYLKASSNCDVLSYSPSVHGPSFIKIENLQVNGNKSNNTKGHGITLRGQGATFEPMDVNFQNVWVFNCAEDGFHVTDQCYRFWITAFSSANKTIKLAGDRTGIYKSGGSVVVENSTINDGTKTLASDSTYDAGTNTTTLTIVEAVTDGAAAGKVGLARAAGTASGAWGIVLSECLSETNGGHGLFLHGNQCYVNGGFYAYSTGSQIYAPDPCGEVIIRGVNCRTLSAAAGGTVIYLANPIRCMITGCMIHYLSTTSTSHGIYLGGYQNCITGNIIRDSASGNSGIYMSYSGYNAIQGNVFSGWGTANIKVVNGSGNIDLTTFATGNIHADGTPNVGVVAGASLNMFTGGFPNGATQAAAGVAAGNLWHDTDDGIIKMGV